MYKGKEICQGCKETGESKPRWNKADLCSDCEKTLKIGLSKECELNEEYVRVTSWPNLSGLDFGDNTLSNFLTQFLQAVQNKNAETKSTIHHPFNNENIHGSNSYNIPLRLVEPMKEFFGKMNEWTKELRVEKDGMPKLAREEVQKEKDRIYNEGLDKGRNLLLQLNQGSITQHDFEKNLHYPGQKS